jgi:hypothetical protein
MKNIIIISTIILSVISCSKGGDDRLAEQESIKAKEQVNAENENRRELSTGPEKELNEIKHFMNAVEGEYKGSISISNIPLDVHLEIIPSKEIRFYKRIRTVSEIQADRKELTLTIKALIENPNVPNSGSICIFEGHRPNTKKGLMKLIKDGCNNTFRLGLDSKTRPSDITSNRQVTVDSLEGSLSTGVSSTKHSLMLSRI